MMSSNKQSKQLVIAYYYYFSCCREDWDWPRLASDGGLHRLASKQACGRGAVTTTPYVPLPPPNENEVSRCQSWDDESIVHVLRWRAAHRDSTKWASLSFACQIDAVATPTSYSAQADARRWSQPVSVVVYPRAVQCRSRSLSVWMWRQYTMIKCHNVLLANRSGIIIILIWQNS